VLDRRHQDTRSWRDESTTRSQGVEEERDTSEIDEFHGAVASGFKGQYHVRLNITVKLAQMIFNLNPFALLERKCLGERSKGKIIL
jgi:hypothetical protein